VWNPKASFLPELCRDRSLHSPSCPEGTGVQDLERRLPKHSHSQCPGLPSPATSDPLSTLMDSGVGHRARASAFFIECAWSDERHECPFVCGIAGSAKIGLRNKASLLLSYKYTSSHVPETVQLLFYLDMDLGPHLHIFLSKNPTLTWLNKRNRNVKRNRNTQRAPWVLKLRR